MKEQIKILIFLIILVFIVIVGLAVFWINTLQAAHSSFGNYYKFRGCTELINKTGSMVFAK